MSRNTSARNENLRWPLIIVKLRKGHKNLRIFENKILLKFKKLKSSKPFRCLERLPTILFKALISFTGS